MKFDYLQLEIWGESHAEAIGIKLGGIPVGTKIDISKLQEFLDRRKPGKMEFETSRIESDIPEFDYGIESGIVVSPVIKAHINNTDVRSSDYGEQIDIPRPGHSDLASFYKYGKIYPGAGPFSGRMTACITLAGGIALQILEKQGIRINASLLKIGGIDVQDTDALKRLLDECRQDGDTLGIKAVLRIDGLKPGIGGPLFDGLDSKLAHAMFAIPSLNTVEIGNGANASLLRGSKNNDQYYIEEGEIRTKSNNQGGLLGGVSIGEPIELSLYFKPIPSIKVEQDSVNLKTLTNTRISTMGRFDVCLGERVLPVIEASAALVILDEILGQESDKVNDLRAQIDCLDNQILELLNQRFDKCKKLGKVKTQQDKEKFCPEIYDRRRELWGNEAREFNSKQAEEIYQKIHEISLDLQIKGDDE